MCALPYCHDVIMFLLSSELESVNKANPTTWCCSYIHQVCLKHSYAHDKTEDWLTTTAKFIVETRMMPKTHKDQLHKMHSLFLHTGCLCCWSPEMFLWKESKLSDCGNLTLDHLLSLHKCKDYANETSNTLMQLESKLKLHTVLYTIGHSTQVGKQVMESQSTKCWNTTSYKYEI